MKKLICLILLGFLCLGSGFQKSTATLNKAKISKTGTQSITNNVQTIITFNQIDFDNNSIADLANEKLIIPVGGDGDYDITGNMRIDNGSASASYFASILKNGSSVAQQIVSTTVVESGTGFNISIILPLVAGDEIQMRCFQSSNSAKSTNTPSLNFLEIHQRPTLG